MAEATPPANLFQWLKGHIPTRDTVHRHRLLKPFAPHLSHSSLWRMNRRSVPRGVALGLFMMNFVNPGAALDSGFLDRMLAEFGQRSQELKAVAAARLGRAKADRDHRVDRRRRRNPHPAQRRR